MKIDASRRFLWQRHAAWLWPHRGFIGNDPERTTVRHLRDTIRQLDCFRSIVSMWCAPHITWCRSPASDPTDRAAFDKLIYRTGEFAEHWHTKISIIPAGTWPLLRYRRETDRVRPWGFARVLEEQADYAAWVVEEIKRRGPLAADDLPASGRRDQPPSRRVDRNRKRGRAGGTLPAGNAGCRGQALRISHVSTTYPRRLIPTQHRSRQVEYDEGRREILLQAARAHAVGTAKDLADYFRMPVGMARPRLRELWSRVVLHEARVEGLARIAYSTRTRRRREV